MILIVTLNPLLERRLNFNQVSVGQINRNGISSLKPGGKGINVSRQLKKLGLQSHNIFFSGGTNGKLFRDILKKEQFDFSSFHIKSETRYASVIINEKEQTVTSYFSKDPIITPAEADEFVVRLEKMIKNCEMVVFSGSSLKGAEHIIPQCIELAHKYDKVSFCDTYGQNLIDVLNQSPTVIHNNFNEVINSLNISLNSESEILAYLENLYSKGILRAFLTNGENPYYASNFDYYYKITPPKVDSIDSTGCGDTFLAGIIYGWHKNLVFEDSVKISTALAALNSATFEASNVNFEAGNKLKDSVIVESIGKKIKTIDDSPN